MGSATDRLNLFKIDASSGGTDVVDVEQNLNTNYDILDDNAPLRNRPNGVFPTDDESFRGGMLYQNPSGKVYNRWDDEQYRCIKQIPSSVRTIGNTGASIGTGADVYLNWGHTENRDGMEFEADGEIRFKTTGLYYVGCSFNLDGTAGNYQRYLMVMVSDAANVRKMRFGQNKTQGNVARLAVGGFVKIDSSRIGWKASGVIFQNSGATVIYNDLLCQMICTRVGGYLGD